jgi:hypothetical protein
MLYGHFLGIPGADYFSDVADIASLEKQLNHIVPALEVASEDLSLHIECLIDEISRSASRLHYDLQFMRGGALSVQVKSYHGWHERQGMNGLLSGSIDGLP